MPRVRIRAGLRWVYRALRELVAGLANDVAVDLRALSDRSGWSLPLRVAEAMFTAAVRLTEDDNFILLYVRNLGLAMQARAVRTESADLLDRAIRTIEVVVEFSAGHADQAGLLGVLAELRAMRFDLLGGIADLESMVRLAAEGAALCPPDDPELAEHLTTLSAAHHLRYQVLGEEADLDAAERAARRALAVAPAEGPGRARFWSNLSNALLVRYERRGDLASLDEAVEAARTAVAAAGQDDPDLVGHLTGLANTLDARFGHGGSAEDLTEAFAIARRAGASAREQSDRALAATCLGNLSLSVVEAGSDRSAVDEAVDQAVHGFRAALDSTPASSHHHAAAMSNLGLALSVRHEHLGDEADLRGALALTREAVARAGSAAAAAPVVVGNLIQLLITEHESNGSPASLDEAVALLREATADPSTAGRIEHARALADALRLRHDATGRVADLDEAETTMRGAVRAVEEEGGAGGAVVHAACLTSLSSILLRKYENAGSLTCLDEADDLIQRAIGLLPESHPSQADVLANLCDALRIRYHATGDRLALDAAVDAGRRGFAVAAGRPAARIHETLNLSLALHESYERTGDRALLDEAIRYAREPVTDVPRHHPLRPLCLANLANALHASYEDHGAVDDLDEAIGLMRAATGAMSPGHRNRPAALANLGIALLSRYEQAGQGAGRGDGPLSEAVTLLETAISETSPDWPEMADYQFNLGAVREAQHRGDDDGSGDGEERRARAGARARAAYEAAGSHPGAPPTLRVTSYTAAARLAAEAADWDRAASAAALAVGLLPRVAPGRIARRDREQQLARFAGITSDAAAYALMRGDPEGALRLLEQGRGVLSAGVLNVRGKLARLAERDPDLAREFLRLRDELDGPATTTGGGMTRRLVQAPGAVGAAGATSERGVPGAAGGWQGGLQRRAAERLDAVLARIRALGGEFADFLEPPRAAELLPASAEGPVVLLNVSTCRSDALILVGGELLVLRLPRLTLDRARSCAEVLGADNAHQDRPPASEQEKLRALEWLWDAVAAPVLDLLDTHGTFPGPDGTGSDGREPAERRGRLWWSPAGPLAFLPLHAAGYHVHAGGYDERSGPLPPDRRGAVAGGAQQPARAVVDRVVSSYTPTVRALLEARRQRVERPAAPPRALVVAMPTTPGLSDLPRVREEAEAVTAATGAEQLIGAGATGAAVLDRLASASLAHFACHGTADGTSPSDSLLWVYDHETEPLTVERISRVRPTDAVLAVLSACTTATSAGPLADEAIHIASAFLLAGYPQVVGTLWEVPDRSSLVIMRDFYARLPTSLDAAGALHEAMKRRRSRRRGHPTLWAAYVHVGA
ncbi:CHAT domain-containing protein [Frankia sp. EI5c]|uniref:CHAT domain-containing tetratricopeptide repeat protein n=1 Tax=Frankia sp. EI5c TaxID=683316 RepID=UPI0007C22453|nr:CHAT domain-containing protein [Frankia sp. EI5c]OAA27407.1 CHAT domain-containing protein [Frankia sp. EI5c]